LQMLLVPIEPPRTKTAEDFTLPDLLFQTASVQQEFS
jgi:hypothetical protein